MRLLDDLESTKGWLSPAWGIETGSGGSTWWDSSRLGTTLAALVCVC